MISAVTDTAIGSFALIEPPSLSVLPPSIDDVPPSAGRLGRCMEMSTCGSSTRRLSGELGFAPTRHTRAAPHGRALTATRTTSPPDEHYRRTLSVT
jgi:hypothetical protein